MQLLSDSLNKLLKDAYELLLEETQLETPKTTKIWQNLLEVSKIQSSRMKYCCAQIPRRTLAEILQKNSLRSF